MTTQDIMTVATHPLVLLCFPHWDTERWAFAKYFLAMQAKSLELLSLREMIDRFARSTFGELAQDAPELIDEVMHA